MKFERLSENKIRIVLTINDLKDKDIDFHDFMSNPLETQGLFLDILEEAKEKIGFNTNNYKVKIEALAMIDGDFIVNITRLNETDKDTNPKNIAKKKFKVRRKSTLLQEKQAIYKFDSFDDYCYFIHFLAQNGFSKIYLIAKEIMLYRYENEYYLILKNVNTENDNILKFYSAITEFGTYINHSTLFLSKICECGNIVIRNNALKISLKHYQNTRNKM